MLIPDSLLLATVLVSVVTDLLERRIYNVVTFPMVLAGILLSVAGGGPWWAGLAGALVAGLAYLPLYAFRIMGAGDVKLIMAVGALGGMRVGLVTAVGAIIVGGVLSAGAMYSRKRFRDVLLVLRPGASPENSLKVPYGVAIALASVAALVVRDVSAR